jgi:hypothetical protein
MKAYFAKTADFDIVHLAVTDMHKLRIDPREPIKLRSLIAGFANKLHHAADEYL